MTIRVPTFIDVISEAYPGVSCNCYGNPYTYENLEVTEGTLPTENELRLAQLNMVKSAKIVELSEACGKQIISGFTSSVLGSPHVYDTSPEDQINLLGSVSATMPDRNQYYSCRDPQTLVKTYRLHSHTQLRQLLDEGALWKLGLLQTFNTKKNQIISCTTIQEVLDITW